MPHAADPENPNLVEQTIAPQTPRGEIVSIDPVRTTLGFPLEFITRDIYADLLIENRLVIELKACGAIVNEHVAQLIGYLRSTRFEHGLLINFGAPRLYIKKYIFTLDGGSESP